MYKLWQTSSLQQWQETAGRRKQDVLFFSDIYSHFFFTQMKKVITINSASTQLSFRTWSCESPQCFIWGRTARSGFYTWRFTEFLFITANWAQSSNAILLHQNVFFQSPANYAAWGNQDFWGFFPHPCHQWPSKPYNLHMCLGISTCKMEIVRAISVQHYLFMIIKSGQHWLSFTLTKVREF